VEIRNARPYPLALDGTVVAPGDTITVPVDIGRACLAQPANWQPVREPRTPKPVEAPDEPPTTDKKEP
jgi:hypothetical protein